MNARRTRWKACWGQALTGSSLVSSACLTGHGVGGLGGGHAAVYRWFTTPEARRLYPAEDHPHHSRVHVAQLRSVVARHGPQSPAAHLAQLLVFTATPGGAPAGWWMVTG